MNRDLLHSVKPWTSFIKRRSMSLRYSVTDTRLKTSIRRWKWLTGLWTKKHSRSPCISAEISFRKFGRLARSCSFNHFPIRDKTFSLGEKVPVRADEGFGKYSLQAFFHPSLFKIEMLTQFSNLKFCLIVCCPLCFMGNPFHFWNRTF